MHTSISGISSVSVSSVRTPTVAVPFCAVNNSLPGPGHILGRYRLVDKLGEGGIGVVYRAEDLESGRLFAVKVLRPAASVSDVIRQRFEKEARLLASVNTPYVTRLIDAGIAGDVVYMVMELVAGPSVGEMLRNQGKLAETVALEIIIGAARGLAAVHDAGIIHRDIKPDNLIVMPGEAAGPQVKVADFGLARLLEQSASQEITKAGVWVGTPLYMAPEQFGSGRLDARADIYALGATLYHMLAGKPPFPINDIAALAGAVLGVPAPAVERMNPDVSAATSALVAWCLQKSADARPADVGVLLAAIERLLGGQPLALDDHPRLPEGSRRAVEFTHTWELATPPAKLWPYVSNTERLNRAVGLPAVRYTLRRDAQHGLRRFASARLGGMAMEWEEHPFEWVEGRRMGVLREFRKGPFVWFASVVELIGRPDGGTSLRHTLRAEPRNLLGAIGARIELGFRARRSLGRVYARIDGIAAAVDALAVIDDPFELPARLSATRIRRLKFGLKTIIADGAAPAAAEALGTFLCHAPDQEAARIRPIALAHALNVEEVAFTDCCLRAARVGLLVLKWDLICPTCRLAAARKDLLRDLREHETCASCDADFDADFAKSVELVFVAHPEIRPVEHATYCAGGPAHSPHVIAQIRIEAGERVDLDLNLSPGRFRIRGPQLTWSVDLAIEPLSTTRRIALRLSRGGRTKPPALAPGGQSLTIDNDLEGDTIVRIERVAQRNDAMTAARATALPVFRELFPGELLAPGQLVSTSAITLLLVQVMGGESLGERLGDAHAFQLVQAVFRVVERAVRHAGGAIIKTADETVFAAFGDAADAMCAALDVGGAVGTDPIARGATIRAAVHRDLAFAATLNDRIDYYGAAPRSAAKLLKAANAWQLLFSAPVADDLAVTRLLGGRQVGLVPVSRRRSDGLLARLISLGSPPKLESSATAAVRSVEASAATPSDAIRRTLEKLSN